MCGVCARVCLCARACVCVCKQVYRPGVALHLTRKYVEFWEILKRVEDRLEKEAGCFGNVVHA